ncbi:hypothetical protein Noc_0528 [Nitrosococcus oceani ATCC 19707]|uniref:Uncharacterized protein n=2 Tax=Nitrosococcus oceani TaxID=1229 RepID=Q3JDP6_NITOC|nr:hypothetical protein [Nitrosococcus oceani]ABA57050.1 hypothetical protein Noc_0528 [Nitrosococcus oceani ATCC 19707]EDZ65382.1 hypothetical protein NOC27_2062 [Nitrosococcus oceani AFC27]KFI20519.1 hypothetical protein IB75_02770 [Nitrosococcus oceani C-27]
MDDDEFRESLKGDPVQAAEIYWKEMLYRAHIVCLVSAFKTLRWIEALDSTFENYYGFCTSLRGLIESCSDAFYTLRSTPLTLARDFFVIKEQINRRSGVITLHENLEGLLLHYIQATRLSPSQKRQYPDSFSAKSVRDYLSTMDNEKLDHLYQWLCGIAHPAYESTRIFLFCYEGQTIVCNDSYEMERVLIRDILQAYAPALTKMIRTYMNNLISIFMLLNEFEIENIVTTVDNESEFKETAIWAEVQQYIYESEFLYRHGHYEQKT